MVLAAYVVAILFFDDRASVLEANSPEAKGHAYQVLFERRSAEVQTAIAVIRALMRSG